MLSKWFVPVTVVVTIVASLAVWEGAVHFFNVPLYLLPPPSAVLRAAVNSWSVLVGHLWVTLFEIAIGFVLSIVAGVPIGIMIVSSRWLEQVSYVLLVISQAVPKVALAPLFLIWLGFGVHTIVLVTFLIAFFPIVISTVVGLRAIHPEMLMLAKTLKASSFQTFWRFRLPAALPSIFGGLKVASTLAVVGAIVAEFVGSQSGLGHLILTANANFQTPLAYASIVVLSVIGLALFYLIAWIERRVVFWRDSDELGKSLGVQF